MAYQDLLEYIQNQLTAGKVKSEIETNLQKAGWQSQDIDQAFGQVSPTTPPATTPPSPPAKPNKLPSPTELLNQAWNIFRQNLKTLVLIMAIPYLLMATITFALTFLFSFGLEFFSFLSPDRLSDNPLTILAIAAFMMVCFAILMIINVWSQIALLHAVAGHQEKLGFKESFRLARKKIFPAIGLISLSGLIIFGGMTLLFIPGIIFSFWFTFAIWTLVVEDKRGFQALMTSREYIKNHVAAVIGRLFVLGIIYISIFIIPSIVQEITETKALEIILGLMIYILSILFTPISVIYHFLIFQNLKAIKGDLQITTSKKSKITLIGVALFGLLIVPLGIGLLIMLAINPLKHFSTAKDAQRQSDQRIIQFGLASYYSENEIYPSALEQLVPEHLDFIPKDPETKQSYRYTQLQNGQDYQLCIEFESKENECVNKSGSGQTSIPGIYLPSPTSIPTPISARNRPCQISGCNNELCVDITEEVASVCIYRPEFGCYRLAKCEVQTNGKCGWTKTIEFQTCLDNIKTGFESETVF